MANERTGFVFLDMQNLEQSTETFARELREDYEFSEITISAMRKICDGYGLLHIELKRGDEEDKNKTETIHKIFFTIYRN
jgi:hypothetical protein